MKINSCSARLELYRKDSTHESKIHKKSQLGHFSHLQGSCIGSRKWLFQERFHCFAASPVGPGISSTTQNIPSLSSGNALKLPSRGQDSSKNTNCAEVPMPIHSSFVYAKNFTQKSKQILRSAAHSSYTDQKISKSTALHSVMIGLCGNGTGSVVQQSLLFLVGNTNFP